jgi:hypothetical protein
VESRETAVEIVRSKEKGLREIYRWLCSEVQDVEDLEPPEQIALDKIAAIFKSILGSTNHDKLQFGGSVVAVTNEGWFLNWHRPPSKT